jgi:TPR repeat protein
VARNIKSVGAPRQNRRTRSAAPHSDEAMAVKKPSRSVESRDDARVVGRAVGRHRKKLNSCSTPTVVDNRPTNDRGDVLAGEKQYAEALRLAREADRNGDPLPVALLRQAAGSGYAPAVYALANWHLHGKGVKRDYKRAVSLLRQAANERYAAAEYDLAFAYELGKGIRKSQSKAFHYYLQAANDGDLAAQAEVARCYYCGLGTKKDLAAATQWYTAAAKRGDPDAQYALGVVYEYGDGVDKNLRTAKFWYKRAASKGIQEAAKARGR